MDTAPLNFNNYVNSIIFTNINSNGLNQANLFALYDFINNNLGAILNTDKCQIHCRKIPSYHISILIDWCVYFNTNDYKCNTIMRKLVYILYYYIQDHRNMLNLFKLKNQYDKSGIEYLKELLPNIKGVNPTIKNLLTMLIEEVDEYVGKSRLYVKNILNIEMITLPTDLINLILGYMTDLQVLEIAEIF